MSAACKRARELLSARLDQPLDDRDAATLQLHLTRCPECAHFERRLLAGMDGIAALPPLVGSRVVRAAVLERMEERHARRWLGQGAKLLAGTAAAVVLTLLLMTVFRGNGSPGDEGVAGGPEGSFGSGAGATTTPSPISDVTPVPISTLFATLESMTVCAPSILVADEDEDIYIWAVVEIVQECALGQTIEIMLVGADGEPLAVANNPLSLPLISLSSRPLNYVGVVWENWCGDTQVRAEATHTGAGSGRSLDVTPECAEPDAPSRIEAHIDPPPAESLAEATPSPQPKPAELGVRTADGQVIITNVESGELVHAIDADLGGQDFFASFSGDESRFAFIDSEPAGDGPRNVLEVYDTATWQLIDEVEVSDVIRYFSPYDGMILSQQGHYAFVYHYNERTRNDGPVRYWLSAYDIDAGLWLSPEVDLPDCGVATLARAEAESAVAITCGGGEPQVIQFSAAKE